MRGAARMLRRFFAILDGDRHRMSACRRIPSLLPPDATSAFCTRRCQWVLSGLLLLLGLGLTVLIATRLQDHKQLLARTQFEHLAQARLARLHERLDERVRDLESVRYLGSPQNSEKIVR